MTPCTSDVTHEKTEKRNRSKGHERFLELAIKTINHFNEFLLEPISGHCHQNINGTVGALEIADAFFFGVDRECVDESAFAIVFQNQSAAYFNHSFQLYLHQCSSIHPAKRIITTHSKHTTIQTIQ